MADPTPGDWLRAELERRNLTVVDVASATGVHSTQAVYTWLSGRSKPKDEAVEKIAQLLDRPVIEVRRRLGLRVPEEWQALYDRGYDRGSRMDDQQLTEVLQAVDHRLLLAELARRLEGRD